MLRALALGAALASAVSSFAIDYVSPSTVLALQDSTVVRVAVTDLPVASCSSLRATAEAKTDSSGPHNCTVLSCQATFVRLRLPPLPTGTYTVTISPNFEAPARGSLQVESSQPVSDVTPSFMFASALVRTSFTVARISFAPFSSLDDITAKLELMHTSASAQSYECIDQTITEHPSAPSLLVLSCLPRAVSGRELANISGPLTAILSVYDNGAPVVSYVVENALTLLPDPVVTRIEPSPTLPSTAAELRALVLSTGLSTFPGTVPLCVRIVPASGTVTVDDAATLFSADFLSLRYMADAAAPGPAHIVLGAPGSDIGTDACIPLFTLPAAVTIAGDAPPPPPPVLAVFPREIDVQAVTLGGGLVSLAVDASLPRAALLQVTVGLATAWDIELAGRGLVFRLSAAAALAPGLASVVVRNKDTDAVLAFAPNLLQFRMQAYGAVYFANPPFIAVAAAAAAAAPAEQRSVVLRGRNLADAESVRVSLCGTKVNALHSKMPDTDERLGTALSVDFTADLDPIRCPELVYVVALADGLRTVTTFIVPVMSVDVLSVHPSTILMTAPGFVEVKLKFAKPLPPFPFALRLGSVAKSTTSSLLPSGVVLTTSFTFSTHDATSAAVTLTVFDLSRGTRDSSVERLDLVTLPLDVVLITAAVTVTGISPGRVNNVVAPTNVVAYVSGCHGRNDAYTVTAGPYTTSVHHWGPYFVAFDFLPLEGGDTFVPGAYDIVVRYRGDQVARETGLFSFIEPAAAGVAASGITPMWLFASPVTSNEFKISGAGLTAITRVEFAASGELVISTSNLIRSPDGLLITFACIISNAGDYTVTLHTATDDDVALLAFVAVDVPTIRETFPNGTIPLGPRPSSSVPAAAGDAEAPDAASKLLGTLTLRIESPTALARLPIEFYAVFESDGTEVPAVQINHVPQDLSGTVFILSVFQRGHMVPADYRLCIRSAVNADAAVTTRELTGPQALLSFDYDEFVPTVALVWPLRIHASVLTSAPPAFRRIVLILHNANGNLPVRDLLRATVDSQPTEIYALGSNFLVLVLPYASLTHGSALEISVLNTATSRTVLYAFGSSSVVIHGSSYFDTFAPFGLARMLVYDDGTFAPLFFTASGARGFDRVASATVGNVPCTFRSSSYDSISCSVTGNTTSHALSGLVYFNMYENGTSLGDTPLGSLAAIIVAPITVLSTTQAELPGGLRRVTIAYDSSTDLSQVPLSPRIFGSLLYRLSDISVDKVTIAFTIQRIQGDLDVGIELYDVSVNNDPERATAFLQLPGARVTFSPGDDLPIWVIILIAVAGGVGGIVAFLIARWLCCSSRVKHAGGDEDEESGSDTDEEEGGAVSYGAAESLQPAQPNNGFAHVQSPVGDGSAPVSRGSLNSKASH